MGYLAIADSVQDRDIVYIGATLKTDLRQRLTDRINDSCLKTNPISQHENCQLSPAEKAVLSSGRQLHLSWAVTENNDSAAYHEHALIRSYKEEHQRLPSVLDSATGWVRGNSQQPQRGRPCRPFGLVRLETSSRISQGNYPLRARRLPHPRGSLAVGPSSHMSVVKALTPAPLRRRLRSLYIASLPCALSRTWMPAFAGMTEDRDARFPSSRERRWGCERTCL